MTHTDKLNDSELIDLLNSHPDLRYCVEELLHIAEDSNGTLEKAGKAEQRAIEELRKTGSVGDGASWIKSQVDEKFGSHGTYLIDLMHLCEYLAGAASSCSDAPGQWLKEQKERLMKNKAVTVLQTLMPHLEKASVSEEEAPVRKAYRYLRNRRDQVDYSGAVEKGLPIGSGEIESVHRYVVQARLKRLGACGWLRILIIFWH